jgi:predicted dehydrogenase
MQRIRWGIFGVAGIARKAMIPALHRSTTSDVVAIASRDLQRARDAARDHDIERAYGSYEELLQDPDIDAIYNPLPNHLHVPWSIRAAEAGKHVLCEKPIAMSAAEARLLLDVRDRTGVVIAEAFMVRTHPRWIAVRSLIRDGRIGELLHVGGHFSYFKRDPADVRSHVEYGGGALMDIGCYPINIARWMFDAEPLEVCALMERDPDMGIDRLGSALLRFPRGHCAFTFGGQMVPWQRMEFFGSTGRIEVRLPFNTPPDFAGAIIIDDGSDLRNETVGTIVVDAADHYVTQVDSFAAAVRGDSDVAVTLEDAIRNMSVIDALFLSEQSHSWVAVQA